MYALQGTKNIDEIAALAIRLDRQLAENACALNLGGNARDAAFVTRALSNLPDRLPLLEADEGGIDAVQHMVDTELKNEIIDTEKRFVPIVFDELGQHGEMLDVPIYPNRGKDLLDLRCLISQFLDATAAVLDHIAAHRTLMSMMSH